MSQEQSAPEQQILPLLYGVVNAFNGITPVLQSIVVIGDDVLLRKLRIWKLDKKINLLDFLNSTEWNDHVSDPKSG